MKFSDYRHVSFGNWKMAQDRSSTLRFLQAWNESPPPVSDKILPAVFPSYVYLLEAAKMQAQGLLIGAQDCSDERKGAFTGEIAASMLRDVGTELVLIGHSERRQRGQETNESLRRKVERALENALTPVFCIGETLEERDRGEVFSVLSNQLKAVEGLESELILAYEPVWAIGTGRTPTLAQIEEVHGWLGERLLNVPVLYGGSVKPENASEILRSEGVRGLLIGGASLQKESFESIVQCALECVQF